jgi:translation elongation factor EF-Ts
MIETLFKLISKLPPSGLTLLRQVLGNLLEKETDEAVEILRQTALATAAKKAYRRR